MNAGQFGIAKIEEQLQKVEIALQWSEAMLAGQKRVLDMLAQDDTLTSILDVLCLVVEEQSNDALASFLLVDESGTRLRHGAAPRLPESYVAAIDGVAIAPSGGTCVAAAYSGEVVIASDIETDPIWAKYRHLPLSHGLRSSWSTPILSGELVLGTFAMYYREPRNPDPHDLHVLEQIASLAAVSIKTQRAKERLLQDERELRQITDAIPQAIVVLGPDGDTLYANRVTIEYTGLTQEEIKREDSRARIFHPDDIRRVNEERKRALESGEPFELEQRLLGKDGKYRWFLIRYNSLRDEQSRVIRWYATGTDIHDRKQTEERVQNENLALREEIDYSSMFEEIVGSSKPLREVLSRVAKVAPTDSTVLILGETGTGKELIARAIHKRSGRSKRAFISVNCAAIPPSLIASELFGHEKGAFTGAIQRHLGRFELADGGTIFLDEVGELQPDTQVALLRALQEREVERVGGSHPISVDVRVLAATNRDLQHAVMEGKFRQDLFYRLNVFPIRMPALRERRDDISLLVEYLIERFGRRAGKKIKQVKKRTLDLLQAYNWPGNVRELQNVVERAVILCDDETFVVDEDWLKQEEVNSSEGNPPLISTLAEHEKEIIEAALAVCKGRIAGRYGAAAKLGIPRQTLDSKISALQINKYRFKTS